MRAINRDKVIEAYIRSPFENNEDPFTDFPENGWQVILVVGYFSDGRERVLRIDMDSEFDCKLLINKLGFINID